MYLFVEREGGVETLKKGNMGADNYTSASSRLQALQNRKQQLEESIVQKNQELRELCIKEAQITSIMPPEVPLEPGENLPQIRRKVGTAFEYPQNLITKLNQEKESISALETDLQVQRCILENASRFVNDASNGKEKHKNKLICEQAKHKIKEMEERIELLKQQRYGTTLSNQLKHKKKPRPPFKFDISSLKNNNYSSQQEDLNKLYTQHQNYPQLETRHEVDNGRYLTARSHNPNHNNYTMDIQSQHVIHYQRQDYRASYTLDRPPVYNSSKDRHSMISNYHSSYSSHPNINYHQQYSHTLPPNTHLSPPHVPQMPYHSPGSVGLSHPNLNYSISPHNVHTSPLRTKSMDYDPRKSYSESVHNGYLQDQYVYPQYVINPNPSPHSEKIYEHEVVNSIHNSPIYQNPDSENTGLGGYWYKNENNESIWVPTGSPVSSHWPRDKRFGSLDRRKDKYVHNKQIETRKTVEIRNIEPAHVPLTQQNIRTNQQLVRTQSLGSVGAQTVDLWPDDNSSCESDGTSLRDRDRNSTRKPKPKGWCETSLDGPAGINDNTLNSNLLEEPLYTPPSRISYSSPQTPKILEIPAETNPSPLRPEINTELLNNNGLMDLPKNCTVVQAGQFKPYREVTKPFEMEDFYKYSTKFKKAKDEEMMRNHEMSDNVSRRSIGRDSCENSESDAASVVQKSIYQPLQPMKCQPYSQPK